MLALRSVSVTFGRGTPREVRALADVTLEVESGSFVVVIGTNGSGKSTLQGVVSGSVVPDEGTVVIAGRDVTRWPEHRRAALVGRVFQNPFSGTAPDLTVAENLALAARRGLAPTLGPLLPRALRTELRERVAALGMGLEERLEQPIGSLSGGQRQALTLLMATWRRPELLLLDEHTAALDPRSAGQVIALTRAVVEAGRLTTLMVTHSMTQAIALGDRLVMVHGGRVVSDVSGATKRRLLPDDLLARFEELRRTERLDASAGEMLRRQYV